MEISSLYRIPVLRSMNPQESARLMIYTANQIHADVHQIYPYRKKRPKSKRKQQLVFLQGFPRIGPKRAQNLLNHFGSIEAVITASPEKLGSVEGIGYRTAKAIHYFVKEKKAPYLVKI